MTYLIKRAVTVCSLLLLAACSSLSPTRPSQDLASSPWANSSMVSADATSAASPSIWQHLQFPGKQPTVFRYQREDGREALAATAHSSLSLVRKLVRIEPADLGQLNFSWKVPALMAKADMALRETDDCSVRIVLAFDGDRSRFSAKNAMLSEMARLLTGEELPYATLMYVWSKNKPAGTVIENPRTDRIRKIVVESGNGRLNRWIDYERTIREDFEKAFGEAPGALLSISVMTDSDNTRSNTQAWYGPLTMTPAAR